MLDQRVDSEDECSLKKLIRRKGVSPKVGVLNNPTPKGCRQWLVC